MKTSKHIPFRGAVPTRSKGFETKGYREYKKKLREDFHKRCGYCDGSDAHYGGMQGSHVDHFAPKSKFPELEKNYENLVYACPFCNRAKSNKWIGNNSAVPNDGRRGFVDPCNPSLDQHLKRNGNGRIVSLTELGQYLVDNLNLRLARHQLIWQQTRIETLCDELDILRARLSAHSDMRSELTEQVADLFRAYRKYNQMLHDK